MRKLARAGMKWEAALLLVVCLFGCVTESVQETETVQEQEAPPQKRPPTIDAVAPDIPGVVAGGTKIEVIRWGFEGTEGAIAGPDGSLLFAAQNANQVVQIDTDDFVSVFVENTGRAIGLAWDPRGRLIGTQTRPPGETRVGVLYPEASREVLADGFEGRPFASPNDLVADQKGGIYFTDLGPNPNQPGSEESGSPAAVYYINPSGTLIRVVEDIERPNGITLSPDESTLYVNNRSEYILAFDVQPDGTVTNPQDYARYDDSMGGDGLTIDDEGRLYSSSGRRIQIFDPTGQYIGSLPIRAQNLAFAGPDKKTLYMVGGSAGSLLLADGAVYKVQMLTEGFKGRAK